MGFFDALASFAPGITAASQGISGALQGVQQRRKQERDDALQMIQQMRQQRIDAQNELLNQGKLQEQQAKLALAKTSRESMQKYINDIRKDQPELAAALDATGGDPEVMSKIISGVVTEKQQAAKADRTQLEDYNAATALFPKDEFLAKGRQPNFDYANYIANQIGREKQGNIDERLLTSIAAQNARLGQSIAAAMARQGRTIDMRPVPQKFVDSMESYQELGDLANSVKTGMDSVIRKHLPATGQLGGLVKVPHRVQDFLNLGGEEGKNVRDQINNLYGTVGKLRGGTAFTDSEQRLLESYLPDINDTPARARQQAANFVKTLNTIVARKKKTWSQFYPSIQRGLGGDTTSDIGGTDTPTTPTKPGGVKNKYGIEPPTTP